MQINGIPTGPTMAASEPPEPPPRNPERINASLHKLAESKTIKSLDSSLVTANDKLINNNNKPLKVLLSLDNNHTTSLETKATTPTATNAHISPLAKDATTPSSTTSKAVSGKTTATTPTGNCGNIHNLQANSNSISNRNTISESSSSPLSSNGSSSNHTLTNNSPMTIDNQLQQQLEQQKQQQQQQQQQRYSFHNSSESQFPSMPTNGGNGACGLLGVTAQVHNGGTTTTNMNSNSNTIMTNHVAHNTFKQHVAAVDKKNANDVDCHYKLEEHSATATSLLLNQSNNLNGNNDESKLNCNTSDPPEKVLEENERLMVEILRLRKLLENSSEGAVGGVDLSDNTSAGDALSSNSGSGSGSGTPQQRVDRLEAELRSARTQLLTLRIDRKKLRSDKGELLTQVKQLCASLQEKEQELREFIRNFQERVRENESNNAKLTGDRDRERWQLLKQARDEAERSLALAQQLSTRDIQVQRLQDQLQEARRQLSGCLSDQESLLSFAPLTPPSAASGLLSQMAVGNTMCAGGNVVPGLRTDDSGRGNSLSAFSSSLSGGSGATAGDRNSCSNDSGIRNSSDRESNAGEINFSDGTCDNGPCITVDPDSISLVSNQNIYQYGTPKERSPTLSPLNSAAYSRSVEQLGSPVEGEGTGAVARKLTNKTGTLSTRNGRGGTWGSISRVFARSRNKNKALSADGMTEYSDYSWSPLSEEGYAEKLRLLREASQMPMERWRASQVLAWLEVALGMPQYSSRCSENVKSGKVLLELNDTELEAGLGLAHPMHRKKLRLAIEEQRRPELVRYPMITQLGHTWVASEWLPDIGLHQYAESFVHSLVDARMLDTLSKKELEKFLGVTRKFHQASIVHGIHVLRIVKYDRQTLAMRRAQAESVDTDPIVWTNTRFIRWVRSIDLAEYADNLKDSGVHGGLVVLEPSFSGDTMATALGIPPSKNIIRRHLTTEFEALILPARAVLGQGIRSGCGVVPITGPGGLQHYSTTDRRSNSNLRISAWKGSQSSLSKAFRFSGSGSNKTFRTSADRNSFGNSTSPTPSYSSSEGGGGIYAIIGPPHLPPPSSAPPPPPSIYQQYHYYQQQHYQTPPAGHRVSAPPNTTSGLETIISHQQLLYDQHRRVKSISDIGGIAGASTPIDVGKTPTTINPPVNPAPVPASASASASSRSNPDSSESSPI